MCYQFCEVSFLEKTNKPLISINTTDILLWVLCAKSVDYIYHTPHFPLHTLAVTVNWMCLMIFVKLNVTMLSCHAVMGFCTCMQKEQMWPPCSQSPWGRLQMQTLQNPSSNCAKTLKFTGIYFFSCFLYSLTFQKRRALWRLPSLKQHRTSTRFPSHPDRAPPAGAQCKQRAGHGWVDAVTLPVCV